ncbi:zinc ribbon domain-containing protein [Desulforhabdus amnigena]|uniref:zinc ribbon domain-containing protein n=1 Tax=Desulforhabdus amnigena TaxID=40218 RepID=UPI0016AF9917|nr:zinc ribbon domain-containing protein [Deltaproteobacteria bacterium]
MFFFIGGIQPKTVELEEIPRLCPACGLAQARLRRVDYYLSLFFIPLFPVKRGEPVLICDRCGAVSSPDAPFDARPSVLSKKECPQCGQPLDPTFKYCPHCGSRI